ncbi:hypothetical protein ALC60_03800, partial [Trachymyrmex zeteki]
LSDKIIRQTSINPFDERSVDFSFDSHGRTAVSSLVTQELIHGGWCRHICKGGQGVVTLVITLYFEVLVEIIASIWKNPYIIPIYYFIYLLPYITQRRLLKSRHVFEWATLGIHHDSKLSRDAIFFLACKGKWRIPDFERSSVTTRLIPVAITSQALNLLSINNEEQQQYVASFTKILRLFACVEVMFLHFPYLFRNLHASLNNDEVNLKFAKALKFLSVNKSTSIIVSHTQFWNTTNLTIKNANNVNNINSNLYCNNVERNEVSVILVEDLLLAAGDFYTSTSNVNAVDLSPRSTNPVPRGKIERMRVGFQNPNARAIANRITRIGSSDDLTNFRLKKNTASFIVASEIDRLHLHRCYIYMVCTQLSLGRQPPRNHEQVLIANQSWTAKRWTRQVDASKRIIDPSIDNDTGEN